MQSIAPISIVVCNLYPLISTIRWPGCTLTEAVEEINIGGALLLCAAVNSPSYERISCSPALRLPILPTYERVDRGQW